MKEIDVVAKVGKLAPKFKSVWWYVAKSPWNQHKCDVVFIHGKYVDFLEFKAGYTKPVPTQIADLEGIKNVGNKTVRVFVVRGAMYRTVKGVRSLRYNYVRLESVYGDEIYFEGKYKDLMDYLLK